MLSAVTGDSCNGFFFKDHKLGYQNNSRLFVFFNKPLQNE
jgi:hypothetical protein